MKIFIIMVFTLVTHIIYPDSAITRYAAGPGFNVYRTYMELTLPGGKWTGKLPEKILINDFPAGIAFDAKVKASPIGQKLIGLNNELVVAVQKDPAYASTISKMAAIDKQVADEMAKQAKNPAALRQAYEQKQKDYVKSYVSAAQQHKEEFKAFQDAWTPYEKTCLNDVKAKRRIGEKDKPVMEALRSRGMQLLPADTVFLIGEQLRLNVGPFDPEQIPAEVVKVIGAQNLPIAAKFTKYLLQPSADAKCEPLRQAAAKAYAQLDVLIQNNADLTAKNAVLKKALDDLNAIQNQTTSNDKLLRKALEREFGMDFQSLSMNQIVMRAAAPLIPKVQEFQKGIPADLLAAQKTYDALATQALDALDAEIQKIIAQRRQAKIAK